MVGQLHGGAPRAGHPAVVPGYRGALDRAPQGCGPVRGTLARAGRSGGTVPVPRQARRHGPAAWNAARRHIRPPPGREAGLHTTHSAARTLAHGTRRRDHHCRATTNPSVGRAGHPPAHGPKHQDHPRLVLPGPCRHLLCHSPRGG